MSLGIKTTSAAEQRISPHSAAVQRKVGWKYQRLCVAFKQRLRGSST